MRLLRAPYTSIILVVSIAVLYDRITKRIPTRLQASQAPKTGYGLIPAAGSNQTVNAKGVDIIFVHGLGSNPDTTWRARRTATSSTWSALDDEQSICWVTDLLPDDLAPNVGNDLRLFFYNYDSYWKRDAVHTRLRNIGKRLLQHVKRTICSPEEQSRQLIFVGYSYGGLVIKQGLVHAFEGEEFVDLAKRTKAVIFLGTPHRGSTFSRLGWLAAQVLRPLGSNPSVFAEVEYDSMFLLDLHDSFSKVVSHKLQVVNFFEQRPTQIARLWFLGWQEFCVREPSATYSDSSHVVNIGLSVDHSGLNKFASRDENYMLVAPTIASIAQSLIQVAERRYVVPFQTSSTYTSRHELSQSLARELGITQKDSSVPHAVAVHGLGGAGKSQLVLDFAESHRQLYDPILWIDATDAMTTRYSFERCAAALNIDIRPDGAGESTLADSSAVRGVLAWLTQRRHTHDEWLVIIDNADDVTWGIKNVVPRGQRGSIIITSRDQYSTMLVDGGCESLEVSVMSEVESRGLLLRHLHRNTESAPEWICHTCDVIAQRLGYLVLALDLAGAYIGNEADQEAALLQYIEDYDNHRTRLLQDDRFRGLRLTKQTVWTVWDATLRKLQEGYPDEQPMFLLAFLARFKGANVQDEMFRLASTGFHMIDEEIDMAEHSLPSTLRQFIHTAQGAWDSFSYRQSRDLLVRYSLVQRVEGQWPGVAIHDLVKWRALQLESNWHWGWWYMVFVLAACRTLIDENNRPDFRRHVIPHLPEIEIYIPRVDDETQANICHVFGKIYYGEGRWDVAEELIQRAANTRKRVLGEHHPHTLSSMDTLALTFKHQGRWTEAEQLSVQVIEARKRALGQDHPSTLNSMGILASIYWKQCRLKDAEQLEVQVMEGHTRALGQDHPDTLCGIGDLASIYWVQGRLKDAEQLGVQVMEARKRVLGDDHPDTLTAMNNLAFTFKGQGRTIDAIRLMRDCVQRRSRVLGEDHPDFIQSSKALEIWEADSVGPGREQSALGPESSRAIPTIR